MVTVIAVTAQIILFFFSFFFWLVFDVFVLFFVFVFVLVLFLRHHRRRYNDMSVLCTVVSDSPKAPTPPSHLNARGSRSTSAAVS